MHFPLRSLNLLGTVALAIACAFQWSQHRRTALALADSEKARFAQAGTLAEQARSIQGLSADLEDLRRHLTQTRADHKESESKLRLAEREIDHLTEETDQLKSSISNWANAVAQRDSLLQEASAQARRLIEERTTMTAQYNALAEKHNRVVEAYNARQTAEPSSANPR